MKRNHPAKSFPCMVPQGQHAKFTAVQEYPSDQEKSLSVNRTGGISRRIESQGFLFFINFVSLSVWLSISRDMEITEIMYVVNFKKLTSERITQTFLTNTSFVGRYSSWIYFNNTVGDVGKYRWYFLSNGKLWVVVVMLLVVVVKLEATIRYVSVYGVELYDTGSRWVGSMSAGVRIPAPWLTNHQLSLDACPQHQHTR